MLRSKYVILFLTSLLQTALWLAALHIDPFGMSTAADRASEEIFLRLYPVLYPGEWRDRVQIVMLDDETQLPLAEGGSNQWPLRYDEYAGLIEKILDLKPKGVFVDVLFDTDERRDPKPLQDFIENLPPDGPPVVFAAYADPAKKILLPKTMPYFGQRALRGLVELSATPHHYQLGTGAGEGAAAAAAVLYNATAREDAKLDLNKPSEFLVTWGNTLHAKDAKDPVCSPIVDDEAQSRWRAFVGAVAAGLSGLVNASGAMRGAKSWERLQPCPYHTETGARQLFEEPTSELAQRIEGSYVLVGAAVAGTGDTANSPVHGQLPGVYLHAMALDNLLTFHGRPLVTDDGWPWRVQAALIFLCAFGGGLVFANRAAPRTRLEAAFMLMLRALVWVVFACAVAALLVAFLVYFAIAPYNWGSVLAIAFAVCFAGVGTELLALVRGGD